MTQTPEPDRSGGTVFLLVVGYASPDTLGVFIGTAAEADAVAAALTAERAADALPRGRVHVRPVPVKVIDRPAARAGA